MPKTGTGNTNGAQKPYYKIWASRKNAANNRIALFRIMKILLPLMISILTTAGCTQTSSDPLPPARPHSHVDVAVPVLSPIPPPGNVRKLEKGDPHSLPKMSLKVN